MSFDSRFLKSCNIVPEEIPVLPPRRVEPPPAVTELPVEVDEEGMAHMSYQHFQRILAHNHNLYRQGSDAQAEADRMTQRAIEAVVITDRFARKMRRWRFAFWFLVGGVVVVVGSVLWITR